MTRFLSFALITLAAATGFAGTQIRLSQGSFNPALHGSLEQTLAAQAVALGSVASEWILQFDHSPTEADKKALRARGFEVLGYIPDDAYVISGGGALESLRSMPGARALVPYDPSYKISSGFEAVSVFTADRLEKVLIQAFPGRSGEEIAARLEKNPWVRVEQADGRFVAASLPAGLLPAVVAIPGVEHVQPQPEFTTFAFHDENLGALSAPGAAGDYTDLAGDESGTKVMGFDVAWAAGLTGKGQIGSMADTGLDTGDANTLHVDFKANLIEGHFFGLWAKSWEDPMGHGTHVAGSILGSGAASGGKIRGGAYDARFVPQSLWSPMLKNLSLPNKLADLFNKANGLSAAVHSNSWGQARNFGAYDAFAQQVDEWMFNNPDLLVLFAAGNSGVDKNKDGRIDGNSIGSPATAKNCLSVGASENVTKTGGIQVPISRLRTGQESWGAEPIYSSLISDNINGVAMFSSRGPTADRRLKPEIVGPGTNVLSNRSHHKDAQDLWGKYNNEYVWSGGTSMSTPLVAGAVLVTRQYLTEKAGVTAPSSALMKAAMLHNAIDMYPGQYGEVGAARGQELLTRRPTNDAGYGRADVANLQSRLTQYVDEKTGLAAGEAKSYDVTVGQGQGLLVNMVYNDAPGSPNAAAALVNDLDLIVTKSDGTQVASRDRINNHEIVELTNLPAGRYRVEVKGEKVPQGRSGKQPYALVMSVTR